MLRFLLRLLSLGLLCRKPASESNCEEDSSQQSGEQLDPVASLTANGATVALAFYPGKDYGWQVCIASGFNGLPPRLIGIGQFYGGEPTEESVIKIAEKQGWQITRWLSHDWPQVQPKELPTAA